jgi:hypothetical protein
VKENTGVNRVVDRDDFSKGVREVLAYRAGFRCSKPDCRAPTAGPSSDSNKHGSIGIAAHITAASKGGPRYDPALSPEDRGSVSNGIWLCDTHAREVDRDYARFTSEILHTWKINAEEEARAMLGRPLTATGLDVVMAVSLQRDLNEGVLVVGETNLPEGTKLSCQLRCQDADKYIAQAKCCVTDRHLLFGPFMCSGEPLPQQWYQIEICSYFNDPWEQPPHVLELTGYDGKKLIGKLARPLDADLNESEYAVEAKYECPAPPLRSESPLSEDEISAAIILLQKSVLFVEGHDEPKSSEAVGDVVRRFMSTSELREREGWSAIVLVPGIVNVSYSYWDRDSPKIAEWQVMPRSKEVRYRNRPAKYMSWSPNY